MKKKLIIAALALVAIIWIARQAWQCSDQQVEASKVYAERATYFELQADGKPIFWFTNINKGIPTNIVFGEDSATNAIELSVGNWTDSRGRALVHFTDTVMPNIGWTAALDSAISREEEEKQELDYYLRTHNVQDGGFDMVARYDKQLSNRLLHHRQVKQMLTEPTKKQLVKKARHTILIPIDSDSIARRPAQLLHNTSSWAMIRTRQHTPDNASSLSLATLRKTGLSKRMTLGECLASLFFRKRGEILRREEREVRSENTLGIEGDVQVTSHSSLPSPLSSLKNHSSSNHSSKQPESGHHAYLSPSGNSFYEGHWENGMRNGLGFSIGTRPGDKEVKLRVGEWKNDVYQGERLQYTSDRIYGIDISRHQHDVGKKKYRIDWNLLRITHLGSMSKKNVAGTVDYPISFIYIKATEGTSIVNPYFKNDYAAARRRGFRVGAYHFFSTRTTGTDQAHYFLKNARFQKGDFPPVLDIEPSEDLIKGIGGDTELFKRIRAWLNIVEQATGQRPILYVNQRFVDRHLVNAPDLKKKYQVWIARYGEYKPDVKLVFWQLSPDGRVRGIQTKVDINVFNGYQEEYDKWKEEVGS